MSVNGRQCVVTWDGRPNHQFAKVRWEDGTESDVLPVCSIQANKPAVEEEAVKRRGVDLAHLVTIL